MKSFLPTPSLTTTALNSLLTCGGFGSVAIDIDAGNGDISNSLQDYTLQANRKLIGDAFGKTDFLKNIPAQTIDVIAAYPDSATCEQ